MRIYKPLPVITYSEKEQTITGKEPDECELMELTRMVDLNSIESYSESVPISDFREDNKIWTSVVMASGDEFIINMPFTDFDSLFRKYNTRLEEVKMNHLWV